jgi:hypothetical protein
MASDIVRFATSLAVEQVGGLRHRPLAWQQYALAAGTVVGLPLVLVPLAMAAGHFVMEARFNQQLLVDLVARPSTRPRRQPGVASSRLLAPEGVSA